MSKTISIMRIALLLSLSLIAFFFILGEEQDANAAIFLAHFLGDKLLGAAAAYSAVRLYRRWRRCDPWLAAFDAWNRRLTDAPAEL